MRFTANTIAVLSTLSFTSALDPNCAPGNNIDLSKWVLQLPTGNGSPTQISPDRLKGCKGYTDKYFNTDKQDGSVIMKVPGDTHNSECVSTPNSEHCRCEFRENSPHAWDPKAPVNRLFGDLRIAKNDGEICIGQIHIDETTSNPKSHKPVAELYVNSKGELNLGVQLCATNDCKQQREPVGKIDPTKRWNYEIRYEKNVLSVSINKGAFKTFSTHKLNAPPSYFKAGNYNQQSGPTEVHFYDIRVTHDANDGGSNPGNPGPDCDGPPAIDSDSTVTLKLFAEETCCKSVQRLKLGEPNSCHNSNAPFKGFNQAVGQKMFGRNIKIVTFEGRDCAGTSATNNLTNNPQCYNNSGKAWNSFMISDK